MEPWPADSTKRSRLAHLGALGSAFRNSVNSTKDMGAQPMGRPGWPELAAFTPSIARKRIALQGRGGGCQSAGAVAQGVQAAS